MLYRRGTAVIRFRANLKLVRNGPPVSRFLGRPSTHVSRASRCPRVPREFFFNPILVAARLRGGRALFSAPVPLPVPPQTGRPVVRLKCKLAVRGVLKHPLYPDFVEPQTWPVPRLLRIYAVTDSLLFSSSVARHFPACFPIPFSRAYLRITTCSFNAFCEHQVTWKGLKR